jgi:hypothetical protein
MSFHAISPFLLVEYTYKYVDKYHQTESQQQTVRIVKGAFHIKSFVFNDFFHVSILLSESNIVFSDLIEQIVQAVDTLLLPVHSVQQRPAVLVQKPQSGLHPVLLQVLHEFPDAPFLTACVPQVLFKGFFRLIGSHFATPLA